MAAVHILIFGEMAGFKIVPFIATHVKMKRKIHGAMKKIFFSANLNSPICMKTTDIKLFCNKHFAHLYFLCNKCYSGDSCTLRALQDQMMAIEFSFWVCSVLNITWSRVSS